MSDNLWSYDKELARSLATNLAKRYKQEIYHYLVGNMTEADLNRELRRLKAIVKELRSSQVTEPF